jgi:hypothetical protein
VCTFMSQVRVCSKPIVWEPAHQLSSVLVSGLSHQVGPSIADNVKGGSDNLSRWGGASVLLPRGETKVLEVPRSPSHPLAGGGS